MNDNHSRSLVIGIDAGGTRTRAYLAEAAPDGAVLGEGVGGPANALSTAQVEVIRHLTAAIEGAVPPEHRSAVQAVAGGFAGASRDAGRRLAESCLRAALGGLGIAAGDVAVYGDIEIAFAAAPGAPTDGLVLIAGTGAVAARIENRRRAALADGDGWLLGDAGSGFWLGREVIRAALRALDGRGPWTSLVERVAAHYLPSQGGPYLARERPGQGERERLRALILPAAYAEPPVRLARLSPLAVAAEDAGDEVAMALLDDAADELGATVAALDLHDDEPLVATGGLLGPAGPLLGRVTARAEEMGLQVVPVRDGGMGAVALARLLSG